jgi:hypothetical protein
MDTRTGKIYELSDDQLKQASDPFRMSEWKITELSKTENEILNKLPEKDRPEKLALMRFVAERKRLKAPHDAGVQNAFLLGYKAAVKDIR